MTISYFQRHNDIGFSIQRVFKTTIGRIQKTEEVEMFFVPSKRSLPWDIFKNSWFTFRHSNKTGINHITGHIHEVVLGLIGCKTVLTIHDLVFIDNVHNPIKKFYKWFFWLYLPIKLSNKVVCISCQTKQNVLKYINTNKLVVIYNPVDPVFEFYPKVFNKEHPVILHIGTGWNKNLKRVVESLKGIPCHLRIIGKLSTKEHEFIKSCHIDYTNVFNLSDEGIKQEYINCDIVSFPSVYEGFGMPIVEGQKTGRVVLSSKIQPLIEVSGDSVCYVNPLDISSIRGGFLKLINDDAYRDKLVKKGKTNVERFQLEKIAQEYLDLYKSILE